MSTPPGPPPPPPPPPPYGPPPQGPGGYQQYPQHPHYPPPPPMPYQGYPGQYPPPQKKSRAKWWLIGGLAAVLLLVIAVGAIVWSVANSGNVTATDVKVGDCLSEIPTGDTVMRVKTIGCEQAHAGEVFAVLNMPDGDFPGQPAVEAYSQKCAPALAGYSPSSLTDDTVQLYVLYPTAETWSSGDRAVTCVATLNPPRAGSIKG
ncbi:septum formation family protein [Mycolicibacterium obuense]|uniref:Septum formation family protein n=1 Tax=Mycolicibacterium obuense TaxID=1807 RepID=A0A0M2JXJ9_9MYCO|nr:septum formation family protein [Mycolicibacterium obuense]KKF01348.1 septum formation family protein [Mycolicibacterium obuense]TDL12308.1 septum formation family protein [Mycolicibacterium obuense]